MFAPVEGAEINSLEVDRRDGWVYVDADMVIEAPRAQVFAALADYDRFSELSRRYIESRFIEPAADGTPRIYTAVKGCVLFFCRTVKRYARLELQPDERIVAIVEPDNSDLEAGREEWQLDNMATGTRIVYRHEMDPDFWVPPVIGVWAIRRILSKDALQAATKLEKLALSTTAVDRPAGAAPNNAVND